MDSHPELWTLLIKAFRTARINRRSYDAVIRQHHNAFANGVLASYAIVTRQDEETVYDMVTDELVRIHELGIGE